MRQQYRDRGVWSRHITKSRYFGGYMRAPYWYRIWNRRSKATYWNGAKNLISTTAYSIACKFDALADMEELHIQKSSYLPNDTLIFIFELHFGYNMEPPYWNGGATERPLNRNGAQIWIWGGRSVNMTTSEYGAPPYRQARQICKLYCIQ